MPEREDLVSSGENAHRAKIVLVRMEHVLHIHRTWSTTSSTFLNGGWFASVYKVRKQFYRFIATFKELPAANSNSH